MINIKKSFLNYITSLEGRPPEAKGLSISVTRHECEVASIEFVHQHIIRCLRYNTEAVIFIRKGRFFLNIKYTW